MRSLLEIGKMPYVSPSVNSFTFEIGSPLMQVSGGGFEEKDDPIFQDLGLPGFDPENAPFLRMPF